MSFSIKLIDEPYPNLCDSETFVNTFMLQIGVLSNHLNGRDTHIRQIKVYGPRPCVITRCFFSSVLNAKHQSSNCGENMISCLLQEPYPSSAISVYFYRVYYLFYCEMKLKLLRQEARCQPYILISSSKLGVQKNPFFFWNRPNPPLPNLGSCPLDDFE